MPQNVFKRLDTPDDALVMLPLYKRKVWDDESLPFLQSFREYMYVLIDRKLTARGYHPKKGSRAWDELYGEVPNDPND